jgi:hypothetical protein
MLGRRPNLPTAVEEVSTTGIYSTIESYWSKGTFATVAQSIEFHFGKRGAPFGSVEEYTQAALDFYKEFQVQGYEWALKTGEIGIKIKTDTLFGIFTQDGLIVTFGLRNP